VAQSLTPLRGASRTEPPFPAYGGDEPFVFASYSHRDADRVHKELLRLQRLGHNVWYDRGIRPGERWTDSIAARLDEAAVFLFFATPSAIASEHCRNEVDYALARGSKHHC
jgi:hypothetical protein